MRQGQVLRRVIQRHEADTGPVVMTLRRGTAAERSAFGVLPSDPQTSDASYTFPGRLLPVTVGSNTARALMDTFGGSFLDANWVLCMRDGVESSSDSGVYYNRTHAGFGNETVALQEEDKIATATINVFGEVTGVQNLAHEKGVLFYAIKVG